MDNADPKDRLQWCLSNGEIDGATDLIEKQGMDVNGQLNTGRCPIHYAADNGQNAIIEYLVGKGAEVDKMDKHGITAIQAAIWEGHVETVQLLLAKGASKDGTSPDGRPYLATVDDAERNQAELKRVLA